MIFLLLSTATPAAQPPIDQARRVIEWQLRSPPREGAAAGLSAEEAKIVRERYLKSIGERPPLPSETARDPW